ncbi:hypothetical protein MHYP_G00351790 [Metynnis hypsauchen]
MLKRQHAEIAPPLQGDKECWYLPLFGVYHPKKPEKIRIVFDSSAAYDGVSLNDVLITGPDLNNSLVGLLMRFRKEAVAITADVEHMFHCFVVKEDHRDFLRFLWYQNNDMAKTYDLVNPAADSEIRPQVTANLMHIPEDTMQPKRFERFSKLSTLIRAIAHLIHIARTFSHSTLTSSCRSWHICQPSVEEKAQAKVCILKSVQKECYQEEIKCIRERLNISSSSSLCKLNPILDSDGLLRVGGRIKHSGLDLNDINPIIVPGRHHLSVLLIRHYHEAVKHQGRHFTEGTSLQLFWDKAPLQAPGIALARLQEGGLQLAQSLDFTVRTREPHKCYLSALTGKKAHKSEKAYGPKKARTGVEPVIFGLRDRRLATWPPCQ